MDIKKALKVTAEISAMSTTVSAGTIFEISVNTNNQISVVIPGKENIPYLSQGEQLLSEQLKDTVEACLVGTLPLDEDRKFIVTIEKNGQASVTE